MTGPVGVRQSVGPRPSGTSYDVDAANYFSRCESAGGSFDLSSVSAQYTESYVKTAVSTFVQSTKFCGVWPKLREVYLLSGVTFPGLMQKLKYKSTAAITNVGFVSGDYVPAGVSGGLTDGVGKYLNLTYDPSSQSDFSYGFYLPFNSQTANGVIMGNFQGAKRFDAYSNTLGDVIFDGQGLAFGPHPSGTGFFICSADATTIRICKNGDLVRSQASTIDFPAGNFHGMGTSGLAINTTHRQCFEFIGDALSVCELEAFSSAVNTLITSLGANTY